MGIAKGAGLAHRVGDGKARDVEDQLGEQISPQPLRLNVDLDKPRATRALVAALERNLARATEPALRGRLAGVIRPTARGAIMSAADHFDTGSKKIRGMARRSLDLDHDRGGAA